MNPIPEILYRGDSDPHNKRLLKATIDQCQLQTNLISGGIGKEIIKYPIIELANKHVAVGWRDTHFLSFTSNLDTAMRFGINCSEDEFPSKKIFFVEVDDENRDWSFVIVELDTRRLNFQVLLDGVYDVTFTPQLFIFSKDFDKYRCILIDVKTYLSSLKADKDYNEAIENATRDQEWLLLPITPQLLNFNQIEFSAILDGGCISAVTKYKKEGA